MLEEIDIRDLRLAMEQTQVPELDTVYESLMFAFCNHLNAFVRQNRHRGLECQAQALGRSDVDQNLGNPPITVDRAEGAWMIAGHNGEGLTIDLTTDRQMVVFWMTYDLDGNPLWPLGASEAGLETDISLEMFCFWDPTFGSGFDPADLNSEIWGIVTLTVSTCTQGRIYYDSDLGSGDRQIERLYFTGTADCAG